MYDIEISQSRFPGKALDPALRGLFPKYHEWTEIHVPKWYARWDEVVYATARRNEIVLLGESDIVVHIIGEGRNGHSDDCQNYLKSRGTDYPQSIKRQFRGGLGALGQNGIPAEVLANVIKDKDFFCRQLVADSLMELLSEPWNREIFEAYQALTAGPVRLLEKYNLRTPDAERERLLATHARRLSEAAIMSKDASTALTDAVAGKVVDKVIDLLPRLS